MLALTALLVLTAGAPLQATEAICLLEKKAHAIAEEKYYEVLGKPDDPEYKDRVLAFGETFGDEASCLKLQQRLAEQRLFGIIPSETVAQAAKQ